MELERIIEILEKHQEWRRDQNVPPKTEMQSPIEIGTAIDYALIELKKLPIPSVSGMFISADYLMGLHSELNREEAESLKEYANSNTIRYRECYGDGSIIYPRWKEANYR